MKNGGGGCQKQAAACFVDVLPVGVRPPQSVCERVCLLGVQGWRRVRGQGGQIRGCLTEMGKGLLGGACLEWGLSGWAGQPYGNTGKRQAGAFNSAVEEEERRGGAEPEEPPHRLKPAFGLFFGGSEGGNRTNGSYSSSWLGLQSARRGYVSA